MADLKITQLTELTTAATTDILPIVDDPSGSPVTKKITKNNLLNTIETTSVANSTDNTTEMSVLSTAILFKIAGTTKLNVTSSSVDFNDDITSSGGGSTLNIGTDAVPFLKIAGNHLSLKEITTPSATAGTGKVYTKSDNILYFQDGAGSEKAILNNVVEDTTPQLGGDLDCNDNDIIEIKTAGFNDVLASGSKSASFNVNFDTSQTESVTLTANTMTATLQTPISGQSDATRTLYVTNGGLATLTWAAASGSVKWAGGSAPTLTSSGLDIISFKWDGSNWHGVASLDFS